MLICCSFTYQSQSCFFVSFSQRNRFCIVCMSHKNANTCGLRFEELKLQKKPGLGFFWTVKFSPLNYMSKNTLLLYSKSRLSNKNISFMFKNLKVQKNQNFQWWFSVIFIDISVKKQSNWTIFSWKLFDGFRIPNLKPVGTEQKLPIDIVQKSVFCLLFTFSHHKEHKIKKGEYINFYQEVFF